MEYWELDNFEEFKAEVTKAVKKEANAIIEKAGKKCEEMKEKALKEAEKLKEDNLKEALKLLEEEFNAEKREIKTSFERKKEKLIESLKEKVFSQLLKELDLVYLFECFKKQVLKTHKKGKFLVHCRFKNKFPYMECIEEDRIIFKFESENVTVILDESELEEIIDKEIQNVLEGA